MILIGQTRWVPLRQWQLRLLPRAAMSYVLAVDTIAVTICALAVVLTLAGPSSGIQPFEWASFAMLAVAAVLHLESVRGIERRRETAANTSPYTNLKSLWVFAGILLLPLSLVIALIVISYVYSWVRVYGRTVAHRKIFSAATFVLASAAAAAVLRSGGMTAEPRVPVGIWSLLVVLAAAGVWWLVNLSLVIGAILLSSPDTTARTALGELHDQLVVVAGLGLGIAVAALQSSYPWVVPVLMLTVLTLHHDLLLPQYQRAAGTDPKTGLASASLWASALPAELDRAHTMHGTVGLLMLDLDRFKAINDTYGHPAGDRVLRRVGESVRTEVRQGDLVARLGGDELAVLLPGVAETELLEIAERIRRRLMHLTVTTDSFPDGTDFDDSGPLVISGVPASMGIAVYPQAGSTMDQLVLAADNALLTAKRDGRNMVVSATTPPGPTRNTPAP